MSAMLQRRILSYTERKALERRIQEYEQRIKSGLAPIRSNISIGPERINPNTMHRMMSGIDPNVREDSEIIRKKLDRDKRILAGGSPEHLNQRRKTLLEKKINEEREYLQKSMCPKRLFYLDAKHPDFQMGVRSCLREHSKEFKQVAESYKNHMRTLDPDSPEKSNIESIRPA